MVREKKGCQPDVEVNDCYPIRIIVSYVKIDPPSDVVAFALPTPWPIGPINVYLLRGEPLTLVDCGPRSPEALEALEAGLAAAGVAIADIELLVLTHQHHDHVGNAAEVVRRSGARVAAFAPLVDEFADLPASLCRQHDYMACLMARHGMGEPELRVLADRQRHDRRYTGSVAIDQPLADGDTIRAGSRLLQVLHRPGHSPSDLIFFDEDDGLLVAGDHLLPHVSSNPLAHLPLGARDPIAAADERTRPQPLIDYLDSLARTAALDVQCALPGHGPSFAGIPTLVAARVALHEERAAEILEALRREPSTARELVDVLWQELPVEMLFLGVCEVLAHLDLLADRGDIRTAEIDGVLRSRPSAQGRAAA